MERDAISPPQGLLSPPLAPYVGFEDSLESQENAALQSRENHDEDDSLLQGERNFVPFVYGFYLALFILQAGLLVGLLYAYRLDWEKACDFNAKVWSLVCVGRGLLQLANNVLITTLRLRRQTPPRKFILSSRFLYFFGFSWWILGFRVLSSPGCGKEATLAETVSLLIFWTTAFIYAIPFFIYAILCLFLPCIIYFVVRFAVRPADRQPTPEEILRQLQEKPYRELLESLRRQYNVEEEVYRDSRDSSLLPSLSIENVLGGVSSLLSGGSAAAPQQQASPTSLGRVSTSPPAPSISVNRACPICMVDLADEDTVLIMPCDSRHFFHKACVEHWLQTSQACPICRSNIVRLVTGTASPPQTEGGGGAGGLELQV